MKMTRIYHRDNPKKWIAFYEISQLQILSAFSKLRRIGYTDQNIIDVAKIILGRVPEIERDSSMTGDDEA